MNFCNQKIELILLKSFQNLQKILNWLQLFSACPSTGGFRVPKKSKSERESEHTHPPGKIRSDGYNL
jgi:hypothetical protein